MEYVLVVTSRVGIFHSKNLESDQIEVVGPKFWNFRIPSARKLFFTLNLCEIHAHKIYKRLWKKIHSTTGFYIQAHYRNYCPLRFFCFSFSAFRFFEVKSVSYSHIFTVKQQNISTEFEFLTPFPVILTSCRPD